MSVPGLLHACGRIFWKLKTVLKRIFLFFAIWIGTWDLQTWTTFVKIFCIVILAEKKLYTFLLLAFLTIILWNSFIPDFIFKFTLNTEPKRKKMNKKKWDEIIFEQIFLFSCTAVIRWIRLEFKFPAKIEMAFSQMLAIRSWRTPIDSR